MAPHRLTLVLVDLAQLDYSLWHNRPKCTLSLQTNGLRWAWSVQDRDCGLLQTLTLVQCAKTVKAAAAGRVPVLASGTFEGTVEEQANFVNRMATDADVVVVLVCNLAAKDESDEVWIQRCTKLLELTPGVTLGLYECTFNFLLRSARTGLRCADPNLTLIRSRTIPSSPHASHAEVVCRVRPIRMDQGHIKVNTSCSFFFFGQRAYPLLRRENSLISAKIEALKPLDKSPLKWYNGNVTTLLHSLREGSHGYSGVAFIAVRPCHQQPCVT